MMTNLMKYLLKVVTKISLLILIPLSMNTSYAADTIMVYADQGVGPRSLANTISMLQRYYPEYKITKISAQNIIDGYWQNNTALLVVPGGHDLDYVAKLQGQGNKNIREYVENGGKYLGICAGAYYGADNIVFDDHIRVVGERELKFYPGSSHGPVHKGFDPKSQAGARAVDITWHDKFGLPHSSKYQVYYNGGGYFPNAEEHDNTKVLALYNTKEKPAAIIECQVGKGTVILSGVHFEYIPKIKTSENKKLQNMNLALQLSANQREPLVQNLLARLLEF